MIRMFLFAVGFFAITIALVVFQPGAGRTARDANAPVSSVTRAEPALVAPAAPAPAALGSEYTAIAKAPTPTQPLIAAAPSGASDDQSLRRMTWETLSNINRATGKEAAPGQPGSVLHTIVRRSLDDTPAVRIPAQETLPTVAAATVPDIYVVQPGDSLVAIADKIYGDVNMTGPLFAANQAILSRPDDLRAGQTLVLPSR